MSNLRIGRCVPCIITACLASTLSALAGPIDPPAGPVAPTPGPEPRSRVTGEQCRVEANHCSTSDVGFDIEGNGNFIIRNTSVNNATDYSIVTNNFYGPIIDRTAAAAQGMSGASAPGTMGSSDPNANFSR